jgi:Tfp pilus assembly protein PilO
VKKFFAQLRPMERRLFFGVLVALIVVLNWWMVWPHFSDWSNLHRRLEDAQTKLALYQSAILQKSNYEALVKGFENQGEFVAPQDQAINFLRTIQSQASASQVNIVNMSRQVTRTNDAFFVEQVQNVNVNGTDEELVDFLYKLGSTASMVRVRDLELQPDPPRQHLIANIRLVASYQKKASESGEPAHSKTTTAKTK